MSGRIKNQYTHKSYISDDIGEVYIQNNQPQRMAAVKKFLTNTQISGRPPVPKNQTDSRTRNILKKDIYPDKPFLNKSTDGQPKGIAKGMFSYPKNLSRTPNHYDKFITSGSDKKVGFNLDNTEVHTAKGFIDSSQYQLLRNLSLDKYRVQSSPGFDRNYSTSTIRPMHKDSSSSSFKFDLSKYKAGTTSKQTLDVNNISEDKLILDGSVNYSATSIQFNRPIGNYKHIQDHQKESRRMLIEQVK
jgi:hypothetical protein